MKRFVQETAWPGGFAASSVREGAGVVCSIELNNARACVGVLQNVTRLRLKLHR